MRAYHLAPSFNTRQQHMNDTKLDLSVLNQRIGCHKELLEFIRNSIKVLMTRFDLDACIEEEALSSKTLNLSQDLIDTLLSGEAPSLEQLLLIDQNIQIPFLIELMAYTGCYWIHDCLYALDWDDESVEEQIERYLELRHDKETTLRSYFFSLYVLTYSTIPSELILDRLCPATSSKSCTRNSYMLLIEMTRDMFKNYITELGE